MYTKSYVIGEEHLDELNHGNYLKSQSLIEEVRREFVKERGLDLETLRQRDIALFIRQIKGDWKRQLFLGDHVQVNMQAEIKRSPLIHFTSEIVKNGCVVAIRFSFTMAMVSASKGASIPIPSWFEEQLLKDDPLLVE